MSAGNLPAFPVPNEAMTNGLSRRDWFAGMALSGVVAKGLDVIGDRVMSEDDRIRMQAQRAFAFADAMLEFAEVRDEEEETTLA